jgi:hypothetical protein
MYLTLSYHLNSGLLRFSAGFNSSTEGLVWIRKNICSRDECWNQLAQDGDQWWAFMKVIVQGSTISLKARSHFRILGTRMVTWSKFLTENQEFWSYLWLSLISGVCCSVHVNWFIFLYVRNKKPTLSMPEIVGTAIQTSVDQVGGTYLCSPVMDVTFDRKLTEFNVRGSVHRSIIHKDNPTRCSSVSKFYFIFIWNSTCLGQHAAHHQELKTALAASGFA